MAMTTELRWHHPARMRQILSRAFAVVFLFLCGATLPALGERPTPILLELFTSEGCSSCPPVDAWVNRLDASQPIPGAQLIVLSEHVDYWDHDGWRDPFSSAQLTDRQRAYQQALGRSDVYTPQIILNGNVEVQPWKTQQATEALQKQAAAETLPVHIRLTGQGSGWIAGNVEAEGAPKGRNGEVWLAVELDHAQSQVAAGENGGRQLTHVGVVQQLLRLGKLAPASSFDGPFRVKLAPGADPAKMRLVAFVQQPGPGRVLGAAMLKLSTAPSALTR
jgi:hypothetical protein